MAKKFPKTIFVKWEEPGRDEEAFLLAGPDLKGMVDGYGTTIVATYQLVETTEAEMVVSSKPPKKAR